MTERERWLAERKKGIGASEAAAVVGQSPYKTNVELWEEKTGRREAKDIGSKPYVKYGNEAEGHLRALFALDFPQYMVGYDQFGMIANNPDVPFAFATLDGELSEMDDSQPMRLVRRTGILEIKTTEIMRPAQWDHWSGRVPQHYYIQLLHQLLATGYGFAVLKAQIKYTDRDGDMQAAIRHYHIERADVADDIAWLAEREQAFWACVQQDRRPNLILPEI